MKASVVTGSEKDKERREAEMLLGEGETCMVFVEIDI